MKNLNLNIKYDASDSFVKDFANMSSGNWGDSRAGLRRLIRGLIDNTIPLATAENTPSSEIINVSLGGVQASLVGTFTGQPTAAQALTLGGQAITARASGAVVNEFNIGASTQATAQNLVAAINASTTEAVSDTVYATYADLSTVKATGSVIFADLPSADDTITLNGIVFTAKASGATGNEYNIGATVAATVENLYNSVIAATNTALKGAIYAYDADSLNITFATAGTIGNAYTLAESGSNTSVSASTLTSGVDNVTVNIVSKVPGKIGNYYTVTENLANFTLAGSATALTGGTSSDYYNFWTDER
jgi:hypothetical protein